MKWTVLDANYGLLARDVYEEAGYLRGCLVMVAQTPQNAGRPIAGGLGRTITFVPNVSVAELLIEPPTTTST